MDKNDDCLYWHALNYRTAASQHADVMWQELDAFVSRRLAAEREKWRAALEYAVQEADGWHDDARGGPIPDERMKAVRDMLKAEKG